MKVLAFDISTSAGFAVLEEKDGEVQLLRYGVVQLPQTILAYNKYPWCYLDAADDMAMMLVNIAEKELPDVIVVEETNLSKGSRYAQKILEFIHCQFLRNMSICRDRVEIIPKVIYLSSSVWRQSLQLSLSKEQKKANAKLSKAKKEAEASGKKLDKVKLGVRGKVGKKHLAINYANTRFDLRLKVKDDDIADAICLGLAAFNNPQVCDGT